jgi:hypothetical protein
MGQSQREAGNATFFPALTCWAARAATPVSRPMVRYGTGMALPGYMPQWVGIMRGILAVGALDFVSRRNGDKNAANRFTSTG